VPAALEDAVDEGRHAGQRHLAADDPRAHGEHVGIVVLAPQARRDRVRASTQRMPRTLLATICSPVPLPPKTMPNWHSPLATALAAGAMMSG
jgi:hypothetical protein